jgi:phospholipase C
MARPARWAAFVGAAALTVLGAAGPAAASGQAGQKSGGGTATPIKHVVVIYGENISFDHYFATYPQAANTDGTKFTASKRTPKSDNLLNAGLLKTNPNLYLPKRLTSSQAMTCDQNHS